MKYLLISILLTGLLFSGNSCTSTNGSPENSNKTKQDTSLTVKKDSIKTIDTVTVIAVGDMMLGTLYPSRNYLPPKGDCTPLLTPLKDILSNADVTFGNLEGVFTDTKEGAKKCNNPKTCYTFGMPTSFVHCFKNAGFDVVSLANNHIGDFGATGRKRTTKLLDDNNIEWAGLISKPKTTFTINNVTYGFCAFAPNTGTVQITDIANAQKIVKELDESCDVVIVSFHGGAEGKKHQHVTRKYEYFLGQNRGNVYDFAHKVIDAGADIVLGHGPHVTRAVEIYKDRFITYSMGNFCTYSRMNITGENGLAPIYKIYLTSEGKFIKTETTPTYQIKYKGGPKIDPQKRVIKIIQKLTKQDIPDQQITITDDGLITK